MYGNNDLNVMHKYIYIIIFIYKVVELKQECELRSLSTAGLKVKIIVYYYGIYIIYMLTYIYM